MESFEVWLWRGIEPIITQSQGEEYPTYNKKMEGCGSWISHILRWKCLLKYVTEVNIQAPDTSGVKTR
jgi:hypothetical protein